MSETITMSKADLLGLFEQWAASKGMTLGKKAKGYKDTPAPMLPLYQHYKSMIEAISDGHAVVIDGTWIRITGIDADEKREELKSAINALLKVEGVTTTAQNSETKRQVNIPSDMILTHYTYHLLSAMDFDSSVLA